MAATTLEVTEIENVDANTECGIQELCDLQLALVGGGIGNVALG